MINAFIWHEFIFIVWMIRICIRRFGRIASHVIKCSFGWPHVDNQSVVIINIFHGNNVHR